MASKTLKYLCIVTTGGGETVFSTARLWKTTGTNQLIVKTLCNNCNMWEYVFIGETDLKTSVEIVLIYCIAARHRVATS